MEKEEIKKDTKKKGERCMQNAISKDMVALRERALQRRISFPNPKDEKDTEIENEFFDDMKEKVYEQVGED